MTFRLFGPAALATALLVLGSGTAPGWAKSHAMLSVDPDAEIEIGEIDVQTEGAGTFGTVSNGRVTVTFDTRPLLEQLPSGGRALDLGTPDVDGIDLPDAVCEALGRTAPCD